MRPASDELEVCSPPELTIACACALERALASVLRTRACDLFARRLCASITHCATLHSRAPQGNASNNDCGFAGSAWVFEENSGNWSEVAYLKPSVVGNGDYFGYSVAISNNLAIVGAYLEDSCATGVNVGARARAPSLG